MRNHLDRLSWTNNTAKFAKMSTKLNTLLIQLHKRQAKSIKLKINAQFTFWRIRNFSNSRLEKQQIYRKRWNNCKNTARKLLIRESCMQQHLFEYFQSPGRSGFIEDACITHSLMRKTLLFLFLCAQAHQDQNIAL